MRADPSRLRWGEVVVGVSSVVLLVIMFVLPWYGVGGAAGSINAWHSLTGLRWLLLVTSLAGLSLFLLQLTRRAPALPVIMSTIVTVLGGLTALALIYRVLIDVPGPGDAQIGAFLGLLTACAIAVGGFGSPLTTRPPGEPGS
jgi:hypothetical protein